MGNLEYFAALSQIADRSATYLRDCPRRAGLPAAAADRRTQGYSRGMRQEVGLALAIAKQARALLLDEPTSGLDLQASAEFHDLIVCQRDSGAAVLMVTHDLFRAREVATRIGIMREGNLQKVSEAAAISAVQVEELHLDKTGRGQTGRR